MGTTPVCRRRRVALVTKRDRLSASGGESEKGSRSCAQCDRQEELERTPERWQGSRGEKLVVMGEMSPACQALEGVELAIVQAKRTSTA